MTDRLHAALEIAQKAGKSTLALYRAEPHVDYKADHTPVTQADRNAEAIVRQEIGRLFPGDTVLGEEQGLSGQSPRRWVVDPIDGTKSFIAGVPLFATLLSYEENEIPLLGVAYFPALGEILYAERGHGAFLNGVPARASQRKDPQESVLCHAGLNGFVKHKLIGQLAHLAPQFLATRTWCDAFGHALVATGRAEAMLDPVVSRWDVSALLPILAEAGAAATTFDGQDPLTPVHPDGSLQLLSANPAIHPLVVQTLAPVQDKSR